ncbi:ATP-binding protein [Candidatus Pacearchaeota archaeon]|nr:ATP-binding protein [Candidatus Pacearchaeota archaeon]
MEIEDFNPWWKIGTISEEYKKLKKRKLFYEVKKYVKDKQIIVVTGLRRTGKTVLLYHLIEDLIEKEVKPQNVTYFNFDLSIKTLEEIFENYKKINDIDYKKEKIYVFFDEIQKLDDWQNKIKIFYDNYQNIKFFVSGSSGLFIEKKTKESLAGRSFSFRLFPLKFLEYLELRGKEDISYKPLLFKEEIKKEIEHYIKSGGFPELIAEKDDVKIKRYVKELIIDKIVYIDIPKVFEIDEPELLQRLISIISSSPGLTIDYDGLASDLGRNRKTISNYLSYLENSFIIKKLYNFSKNLLTSEKKKKRFYPSTTALSFLFNAERGRIIENVILQNSEIDYFYRKGDKEIDFIYNKDKKTFLLESKFRKEFNKEIKQSMLYFMKKFKTDSGIIITEDYEAEEKAEWFGKKAKIKFVPLWKWLLQF